MENELNDLLEELLKAIFGAVKKIWVGFFKGLGKLRFLKSWIGLFLSTGVAIVAWNLKDKLWMLQMPEYIRYALWYCLLTFPVIYLIMLGNAQDKKQNNYTRIFKDIAFIGKDGKTPYFCGVIKDGKKRILIFKSNIPLQEWKAAKNRLETGLDCNILRMENGKSKKIVKLITVPSDCVIPDMVMWSDSLTNYKDGVLVIGQGAVDTVSFDLNKVPHVLAAGETGSGKSVVLREMLWQLILKAARVFMIDFKGGVEFGKRYEKYGEVITDRERALEVLNMLVQENDLRLKLFRELEVKNLAEYNRKSEKKLCRIGLFVDELAEMLDKTGISKADRKIYEEIEGKLSTLARLSRATGINLFLGMQRPDAKVLTGQIKNNIPVRISGRFADKAASEIVLGSTDAVDLPETKGRFLYKMGNETIEFQAYYFDDDTMLHDVDVKVGGMLLEEDDGGIPNKANAEYQVVHKETVTVKKKEKSTERKELKCAVMEDKWKGEIPEEITPEILAEMDASELDLNFGEEW